MTDDEIREAQLVNTAVRITNDLMALLVATTRIANDAVGLMIRAGAGEMYDVNKMLDAYMEEVNDGVERWREAAGRMAAD